MLLPKFDYHAPTTLDEACSLLGHYGDKAKCLAGGTDLLVNLKKKLLAPEQIISLNKIGGYSQASNQNEKGLSIGPLCTAAFLAGSQLIQNKGAVLGQAAGKLGSPLIRNRATIGGNLVTGRPASDLAPALLVLGAQVFLQSSTGKRTLALEDFLLGPGQTAIQADEILSEIVLPDNEGPCAGAYFKLGSRKALEISLVNVASFLAFGPDGAIQKARVALGAVAPTPLLSPGAAKVLIGIKPKNENDPAFKEAARAAAQDSKPITDHRGSAEYRREMVEVLTHRTLLAAYHQLMKNA
ncbi:MAG: xanthine dehydrogenase family protein subunit M [Desulfobacca sp.]|nr:xanthine dehydrogenase family protein subunit M [Desulfobacca sp.]